MTDHAQVQYQQIDCVETDSNEDQRAQLTVWVELNRVTPGNVVTFKETGDKEWLVLQCYELAITGVNRGWGLNLPKNQRTER